MNMLRSIREKKGLTLGQLAARASIPSRVLVEYEEGRQPIPLPHAKLLAKALWVRIEDLMPPGVGGPAPAQPSTPAPPAPAPRPEYRPQPPGQEMPATGDAQRTILQPPTVPAQPPRPTPPALPQGAPPAGPRSGRPGEGGHQGQPYGGQSQGHGQPPRRGPDGRGSRPPRPAPPPPKPIGEGQSEELLRLGTRLELDQAQLEERIGKPLAGLTRTEAKDWIKRFRDMLEESSPSGKVSFGQWPGAHEDHEAAYLGQQRDAGTILDFKLFNGEQLKGKLIDFTPYTVTIQGDGGEETVLRKLAIVYYRQAASAEAPVKAASKSKRSTKAKDAAPDTLSEPQALSEANGKGNGAPKAKGKHQPVDTGLDSDRAGEPETPEKDNMDEDRGL